MYENGCIYPLRAECLYYYCCFFEKEKDFRPRLYMDYMMWQRNVETETQKFP